MVAFVTDRRGPNLPARVLISDHARHVVRLIQVNLERQGIAVVPTFDANEAIGKLEASERDGKSDIDTAVIDSYEVLKWIKTRPSMQDVRVIMLLPGDEDPEDSQRKEHKADAYFAKPFNPMELLRNL